MIDKISTGIEKFDQEYGGVLSNRPTLVCGAKGTGKTTLGLSFLHEGLKNDERCLMLSTCSGSDIAVFGESLGLEVNSYVDQDLLFLLEYSSFVPGRDSDSDIMLPPDGFTQLQGVIEEQVINRVVIDTVLPWVAIDDMSRLAEHVFSFIRAFERINVACMMTIPKPVSTAAIRLRRLLQHNLPVALSIKRNKKEQFHYISVDKYIGINTKDKEIDFKLNFLKNNENAKLAEGERQPEHIKDDDVQDGASPFETLNFNEDIAAEPQERKKTHAAFENKEVFENISFVDSFDVKDDYSRVSQADQNSDKEKDFSKKDEDSDKHKSSNGFKRTKKSEIDFSDIILDDEEG